MGKRKKSSRKPAAKKKESLATTFACLFCNHEKSVTCKLDKKQHVGVLHCKVCAQSFQTDINSLSQPIDIYSDWIDACDAVTRDHQCGGEDEFGGVDKYSQTTSNSGATGTQSRGGGSTRRAVDDDDDDDLEEFK